MVSPIAVRGCANTSKQFILIEGKIWRIFFHRVAWFAIFLFIGTFLFGCVNTANIGIIVTNESGIAIQNVIVRFTGGSIQLGVMKTGERRETLIKPTGESHIELDIYPVEGKVEYRKVDTYFEQGYRGEIEIKLGKDFVIQKAENLKVQ